MGLGSTETPLTTWVVSDGRAGIEAQALGLAEAIGRRSPIDLVVKRVAWPAWMRRLPTRLNFAPLTLLTPESDAILAPWPDLWIGNGRAAIPLSIGVRRWSGGRTYVVQLQDPLRSPRRFDMVVPPRHDRLDGENVFATTGTPHRVTPERLGDSLDAFQGSLAPLPRPHIAVLIGGRSRAFELSAKRAEILAAQIENALEQSGGSLLLTFSRRTPEPAKAVLNARLGRRPGMIWDGAGPNPYFAFLASADFILVTEDSANMPAEAAATGRPVYLLSMDGGQARKRRFHRELSSLGIVRRFEGRLEPWTYPPLNETDRAAQEVLRRMRKRAAATQA